MSNVTDSVITDAKRVQQRAFELARSTLRDNQSASETLFDAAQIIDKLLAEIKPLQHHWRVSFGPSEVAKLAGQITELEAEVERLRETLKIAHGGLRRALDYRAGTPEGLAIKADIRKTLIESGDPGPWGVVGSG